MTQALLPDVDGWLSDEEGELLAECAAGKRVLELGSYKGRSTIFMARVAGRVYSVDTFDGRAGCGGHRTFDEFAKNVDAYGVSHRVTVVMGKTADVVPNIVWDGRLFDFAFIDAAHDYESVKADIAVTLKVLAPGALIAFHDYARSGDPGVTQAIDEFIASGGAKLLKVVNTIALVEPRYE